MIPARLLTDSDASDTSRASYTVSASEGGGGRGASSTRGQDRWREEKRRRLTRKETVGAETEPFPPQLAEVEFQRAEGPALRARAVPQLGPLRRREVRHRPGADGSERDAVAVRPGGRDAAADDSVFPEVELVEL